MSEKSAMTCEPLIDVEAVALLIGVSKKTVTRMAATQQIPAMRLGKYWRFRASLLDEWMRSQIQSPHSACPSQRGTIL